MYMQPEINIFVPVFYGLLLIGLPVSVGIILGKRKRNKMKKIFYSLAIVLSIFLAVSLL